MHPHVHCSTNYNRQDMESFGNQPKCPLIDDWIRKMWYIYTMEYYLAVKDNKIMPFSATWMEVETFMLSEVSQKGKDKYYIISLTCGI